MDKLTLVSPYTQAQLQALLQAPAAEQQQVLAKLNTWLQTLTANERVAWALAYLPAQAALSSSFGIQAAVMLHMLTVKQADMPIILTDTGYLFSETYQFIDRLTRELNLNLKVFRAQRSSAWQEAKYGQLWQQGAEQLALYNRINKVEPMQRALDELKVGTWFAGLRRSQSDSRSELPILAIHGQRYKVLPIIDWSNKQVHQYLTEQQLPYHPLWHQGYVSVGDTHSSQPLTAGMSEQETRFNGLKRECGLHDEI